MNEKMTNCKACGQEIAKGVKACPHCGAKNAKPFFTKWWFWVIVVFVIAVVSSSGNTANTTNEANSNTKIEENNSTVSKIQMTAGQKNALKSAKSYLSFSAFSYEGLIKQLEFEKYSHEDAVFAADNCGADWYEQAAKKAKSYLDFSSFSKDGLIHQLEFEGFTTEQAIYGAEANGYN